MIEFIEGEPFCRYNGVLTDEEGYRKLFGDYFDYEPVFEDNIIEAGDVVYTDMNQGEFLKFVMETFAEHRGKEPEYDEILSQGRGFGRHCEREAVECSYILHERTVDGYANCTFKPYAAFKEDHPNFDIDKYNQFMDELDEYYEAMRYDSED